MALPLSNTLEGGSHGTGITTGNSGGASGDAFDNVNTAGGAITYDTAAAMHGGLGARFAASASISHLAWTTASIGSVTDIYGRMYMFHAATPGEQQRIVRWNDSGGTEGGRISWHTDARLYSFDSTLSVPASSAFTLTANQWLRFEWRIFANATTGIIEVKAFVGDSTTELGTYTRTGVNTLTNVAEVRVGNTVSTTASGAFDIDDWTLNATGYPGPSAVEKQSFYMRRMRSGSR